MQTSNTAKSDPRFKSRIHIGISGLI